MVHPPGVLSSATGRPESGTSAPSPADEGFRVATTGTGGERVGVHLVGWLGDCAVPALTAGLPILSGPESSSARMVLLDLSALTHVDDAGLAALAAFREAALQAGVQVCSVRPQGPALTLLDCAAGDGWSPPDLSCTDVLHWHRSGFHPPSRWRLPGCPA